MEMGSGERGGGRKLGFPVCPLRSSPRPCSHSHLNFTTFSISMSEGERKLEEGQIPVLNVRNDGSFMAHYLKGDLSGTEPDAAPRHTDSAQPPAQAGEVRAPPQAVAPAPAPPAPKPAKPPAVLKSKRSVLSKRLPPGAQLPAKKKAKEKGRRRTSGDGAIPMLERCINSAFVHAIHVCVSPGQLWVLPHSCVAPLCVQLPPPTAKALTAKAPARRSRSISRRWNATASRPATRPAGDGPC